MPVTSPFPYYFIEEKNMSQTHNLVRQEILLLQKVSYYYYYSISLRFLVVASSRICKNYLYDLETKLDLKFK